MSIAPESTRTGWTDGNQAEGRAVTPSRARPLAALWPHTRRSLEAVGVAELDLPADLACASGGGRLALRAARWAVGGSACAECRLVVIEGASSTILNVLIFPDRPSELPVFVAELMVVGGCPRLAFLDLQDVGLTPRRRAAVGCRAREIANRYDRLPREASVPDWAAEFSTGGFVFSRPQDVRFMEDVSEMYTEYLDAWIEFALAPGAIDAPLDAREDRLTVLKQGHLANWPGTDYLARLFGKDWTDRFLTLFLYR